MAHTLPTYLFFGLLENKIYSLFLFFVSTACRAMLRRMSPEHKFATAARLCQEILGGAADGALPLSECSEVVRDALRVLASKNIKVSVRGGTGDADIDAGESDPAAAMGAAKGKLVSQMMKKHLAEAVVPVVIELKQAMEQSRHPLLGDLMAAAAAMLKDHKSEIENILAADRQLAKEILYDIRQAEAAEAARAAEAAAEAAEARRQRAMAATAKTPAAGRAPSSNGAAPWSSGGRRPRSTPRPAGTNGSTPMAAEVLRTASKTNLPSGGSRLGLAAAAVSSGTTPPAVGGGTPGTGVLTPGSRLPRTQGAHRGAVSRLARASGPGAAGPQAATGAALGATPAVPRSAGGGVSPAVPMLRGASKTPGTGPAKLRGTPSALNGGHAVGKGGAVVDEDDDEAHVELNFAVPEPGGGAVEAQWNVSPAVVPPPVEDGVGAAGEMEAARENDGEKSERLSDGAEGDCPEAVEKGGGIEAGGSIAGTGVRRSARGRGGGAAGARKRKA